MTQRPDEEFYDLAERMLERPAGLRSQIDAARAERLAQRFQDAYESFLEDERDDEREAGR